MRGYYNYDTRGASHASQIVNLERMVEERDAEIARLRDEAAYQREARQAETNRANALLAENQALRQDAERYRWLRKQHWFDGQMAVVVDPKKAIRLGHFAPSGEVLDSAIDAALAAKGE